MRLTLDPFRLLLISLAGCLSQRQQDVIDYLQEENRVLRQQLGGKRLRLNDEQRPCPNGDKRQHVPEPPRIGHFQPRHGQ